jgi:predicted HTH transcriptional regulator
MGGDKKYSNNNESGISFKKFEFEVAKTICAFLNSKGGYLFIGISDKEKKALGINFIKISKDEFLREFTRIKAAYLPKSICFLNIWRFLFY